MEYIENYKNANVKKYKNNPQRLKVLSKKTSLDSFRTSAGILFKKNDKVLDIAGGPGVHTDILRELGITENIYAIDISPEMITERNKKDICQVGDMENLPYENELFDKALFVAAIHHTDKIIKTLKEAKRVLKPGGSIILIEPISIKLLLRGQEIKPTPDGVEFVLSVRYLLRCLKELNLKIEYIRFYGYLSATIGRIIGSKRLAYFLYRIERLINCLPGIRYWIGHFGNRVVISASK